MEKCSSRKQTKDKFKGTYTCRMRFPNTDFLQTDLGKADVKKQSFKTDEALLWTAVALLPKLHSYFEWHAQRQRSTKTQNCRCLQLWKVRFSCASISIIIFLCISHNAQSAGGKKDWTSEEDSEMMYEEGLKCAQHS